MLIRGTLVKYVVPQMRRWKDLRSRGQPGPPARTGEISEIAAGLEIRAVGAHELAFLLVELCPADWAGAFDQFHLRSIRCAGRHAACRPVVLCRNTRPNDQEWSQRRQAGLRRS